MKPNTSADIIPTCRVWWNSLAEIHRIERRPARSEQRRWRAPRPWAGSFGELRHAAVRHIDIGEYFGHGHEQTLSMSIGLLIPIP